jgi:hypothetical protein
VGPEGGQDWGGQDIEGGEWSRDYVATRCLATWPGGSVGKCPEAGAFLTAGPS